MPELLQVAERIQFRTLRFHEIKGPPPDGSETWTEFASKIPVYKGVNLPMLTEGDEKPFFVTLDILVDNMATSENGLVYTPDFIQLILEQLPGKGAKFGHAPWSDRGSPHDCASWVGHRRLENVIYAKAYMRPGDARENMRNIIGRGGLVRTSLEGYGVPVPILDKDQRDTGTYTLSDFKLLALDFVHEGEAALQHFQSGQVVHSIETITIKPNEEKKPMPEETPVTPVTPPAPAQPVVQVDESKAMSEMKREHQKAIRLLTAQVEESKNKLADFATICEMLDNPEDVILSARNVLTDRDNLRKENGALLKEAIQLQVADKVKLTAARTLIVNMVESLKPVRKAEVATALDKVLQRQDVIEMLRVETQREMGPNHTRPETTTDNPASEPVMFFG